MKKYNLFFLIILCFLSIGTAWTQVTVAEKKQIEDAQSMILAGSFQEARLQLDVLIKKNPKMAVTYKMRGDCKLFQGDHADAISDYNEVIQLAGKLKGIEETYNNRGMAHYMVRNYDKALADYSEAIRIRPSYALPYNGLGVTLEKLGRTDEALANFEAGIKLDPKGLFVAFVGRGNIRFRRNELVLALKDYNFYIGADPEAAAPYIIRGAIHGIRGKWEIGVNDLRIGFEKDRLRTRLGGGVLTVAFADLDEFITKFPSNGKAYAVRGFVNYLRKKDSDAEKDFNRSFELEPSLKAELSDLIGSVKERR